MVCVDLDSCLCHRVWTFLLRLGLSLGYAGGKVNVPLGFEVRQL